MGFCFFNNAAVAAQAARAAGAQRVIILDFDVRSLLTPNAHSLIVPAELEPLSGCGGQ